MSIQLVLNISGNKTKSGGSYWLIREINHVPLPLKPAPQPVQLAELAAKESSWPYPGQDRHVASNVPRSMDFFCLWSILAHGNLSTMGRFTNRKKPMTNELMTIPRYGCIFNLLTMAEMVSRQPRIFIPLFPWLCHWGWYHFDSKHHHLGVACP